MRTCGEQPECFEAKALRAFVLDCAGRGGIGRAKTVVTAVRMFLRFLIAIGRCPPGLDHALPTIAHWRLASLPKYLPAETIERVLATCDLATSSGVRDRAVLLLLARLGLRAGDVAALRWCDIDWHDGTLCSIARMYYGILPRPICCAKGPHSHPLGPFCAMRRYKANDYGT